MHAMADGRAADTAAGRKRSRGPSLTAWILISLAAGMVAGIACSIAVPADSPFDAYVIEGVLYVLGQWFIRLMQMLVVPLVFCSIVCGAASMSDPKMLGKVGAGTILLYLCTTALAVIIAILLAQAISPGVGLDLNAIVKVEPSATATDQTMADMPVSYTHLTLPTN